MTDYSKPMHIRAGFDIVYSLPQPTPMILVLDIHYSRVSDILSQDGMTTDPAVPIAGYRDLFGNWCSRITAPAGRIRIRNSSIVRDSGNVDIAVPSAIQQNIETLPDDALTFLLGSRYCETDILLQTAWDLFGQTAPGWSRVQAICDYVHNHIAFNYMRARATMTAAEVFNERTGVCRDYAHLAITLCRCLNIPARYCTGYLGDMGTLPPYGPGDFAAWFEVYLGGAWYTFDARNNVPRIGRILLARGRDAADVAIATTFGPNIMESFLVWTDEVTPASTSPF